MIAPLLLQRRTRPLATGVALLALALAPSAGRAETYIWVDENGVTQLTNDPARATDTQGAHAPYDVEALRGLWSDGPVGPRLETPRGTSGSEDDRVYRLLRGAVDDLERGEAGRAAAALRGVLRLDPGSPEAHWYLALLDGRRGRYDAAAAHLRAFLSSAGDELRPWRKRAEVRLAALADEQRLADPAALPLQLELEERSDDSFRIQLDTELGRSDPQYASTALRYLGEARRDVSTWLGVAPKERLGVVFYGRAAYQRAHAHRFSFQTVGFFDGRIHVASPAHPSGALRSLLFHEYTHAVFREQTGGDRPYWLNEGLAEHVERRSREQPMSTRSERASLNGRLHAGRWIPLRQLGPGFSGLRDDDARAAYLQSILAVAWIESRTDRTGRARLLERLGQGFSIDQALHDVLGLDTDGLDRALRAHVQSEFPSLGGDPAGGS